MNKIIMDTALQFVQQYFPACKAALLSGSVVRGEQTSSSDLDILILSNDSFRKSYQFMDWPIEVFVHNEDSLSYNFFLEEQHGVPLLTRICAEGIVLKGEELGEALIQEGKELLNRGPSAWPKSQLDKMRYRITDLLDDLEGSTLPEEDLFTVTALIEKLHQFILRANQQWTGEGKWMYRSLKDFNPGMGKELVKYLREYYQLSKKKELIQYIDELLEPYGGRLFDNFSQ